MSGNEHDAERVAAIQRYDVLGHPGRHDLTTLAQVAALVADVPIATINLMTDTQQHQVAAVGLDPSVCARADALCDPILHETEPVVVPDARTDPRFADNPFVTGELASVRFYASYQLATPDAVPIGTLCVFDLEPRTLDAEQRQVLEDLADRIVDLLELHVRTAELSRTVATLEETRVELERSNEHLAAFAGQVSHDLRTPLTAVSVSLRMLADQLEEHDPEQPDEDLEFLLGRALGGTSRMESLIDGLLAFARVGGELRRVPVDLGEVLRQVSVDLAVTHAGSALEAREMPTIQGDPGQLHAVVQNLVGNAAKFTRDGRPARITVSAERRGEVWRVEVHDEGPGVPAGLRESVFRPTVRLDASVEGSGIGLATCRRIVHAHGGRIGLDDSPYGGTLAWFELPALPVVPSTADQPRVAAVSDTAQLTSPKLRAVKETTLTSR